MNLNKVRNKIGIKLLVLCGLCLLVSTLLFLFLAHLFSFNYLVNPSELWGNSLLRYNIVILTMFLLSMGIFIIIFLVPVNQKLRYIQYITNEVRRISQQGDLGVVVEIKGQDELAELGMSINAMSKELKKKFEHEREIEKTKNELISNISHDLRNPLTSILGYIDLIRKNKFRSTEESREYIDIIYSKSQNLSNLVDELFEYTKLSNPGLVLDYRKVELTSLLEQIIGEYIPILEREGLNIKREFPQEDIEVDIDIEKIVRVFENLLENARKYSLRPSEITIKTSILQNKVRISFRNQVEKLPTHSPEKLFERFYKGDIARTEEDSSGLGLAIAKKIIELHGGRIWSNYLNQSIEFVIEMPNS